MAISELHFITPLANLESIFERGILSHNEATPHKKADVSMDAVQEIRATKIIPAAVMGEDRVIHDCANVYFNAKNPMLSLRRSEKDTLAVLRLKPELITMPEAVLSDRNAAVKDANFYKAATGVHNLAMKTLFGEYWTSKYNSEETNKRNGQLRCAELLVPHSIHQSYIGGMYVVSEAVKKAVLDKFSHGCPVPITVYPSFFFDKGAHDPIPPLSNILFPNPINLSKIQFPLLKTVPSSDLTQHQVEVVEAAPELIELMPTPITCRAQTALEQWLAKAPSTKTVKEKSALPKHFTLLYEGSLLDSPRQTLVNTVNCKGAMGKGIAELFKKRYPSMFEDYKAKCDKGEVKPGRPYIYKLPNGKIVINFPTKDHWKNPSQLIWIQNGLDYIKKHYKEWGITSIAIPPLGCGHGGLNWETVSSMIIGTLADVDIPVDIFCPTKN